ncbi:MAG: hypothetical protein GWN89_02305, partial [Thermoplasmata archaeon]|nr:hypothetical protein [Thermoplasmata archaeon]NIT75807.1 hypothetical protein [Thermoplasmata archaeon]NIY02178.1 hypothetical protein [Thermoplasmata archaeon]
MERSTSGALLAILAFSPASVHAANLLTGEVSARYWHATPSGDLVHQGSGAANDVARDLGLGPDGQIDLYARLVLPLLTLDGYTTRIAHSGHADSDGSYGGAYSTGDSTSLRIDIRHIGAMINPVSFLEVVDVGLGMGFTTVEGRSKVASHDDSKTAFLITGKAELRAYPPDSPWMGALSYRGSENLRDLSAEAGYRLTAFLEARAG